MTGSPVARRASRVAVLALTGFLLPVGVFYGLRAADVSVYVSLLVSAAVSAIPNLRDLLTKRRLDGLSAYFTAMSLGAVAISLVSGSPQFLLARDAALTGVTGMWFLISVRARRPLAYVISRPMAEGRLHWPTDWEHLWVASPRFQRMWRVASLLWGIGTLIDAAARVLMAYTLPPDSVPALSTALYVVTSLVLFVGTNSYYAVSGVFDPRSEMRCAATRE
ncbi:MAG: VC0807 family protein [Dermatophilaceae bacterium]